MTDRIYSNRTYQADSLGGVATLDRPSVSGRSSVTRQVRPVTEADVAALLRDAEVSPDTYTQHSAE